MGFIWLIKLSRIREMNMQLDEVTILQRVLSSNVEDVEPLLEYLNLKKQDLYLNADCVKQDAEKIIDLIREAGSNDIATLFRGGQGVAYQEVVYDVADKVGVKNIKKTDSTETLEDELIKKMMGDAIDKMEFSERAAMLKQMNISEGDVPYSAAGTIVMQALLKKYGGFALYKSSVIIANMVARTILGRGLTFAANATLTRSIGMALGPVGWVVSGALLAIDLAGPAYRKTVPAIIHMALLRKKVTQEINIGVVGDGSVGKDALFRAVFGIDTHNINPVAGSTSEVASFPLHNYETTQVFNFPGFKDTNHSVNNKIDETLPTMDVFILVIDISRGVSGNDQEILERLKSYSKPILICLNKIDMVRPRDKDKLLQVARERLSEVDAIETAFDPDERIFQNGPFGHEQVIDWVKQKLGKLGKDVECFGKNTH